MLARLKQFAFRRRRLLAGLYLGGLAVLAGGPFAYVAWVPDDVDTGLVVAARAFFYGRTFHEVERARADVAAGKLALAQERLEHFLGEHQDV